MKARLRWALIKTAAWTAAAGVALLVVDLHSGIGLEGLL